MCYLKKIKHKIYHFFIDKDNSAVSHRLSVAYRSLKNKEENITEPLSETEKKEIKAVWGENIKKTDIRWFELYKSLCPDEKLSYFCPDDFYYAYIDLFFANSTICRVIDDKNMYSLYFNDVRQPKTIARRIDGVLLDGFYQPISQKDFVSLCYAEKNVIIKKSVDSVGGKGIVFFNAETDNATVLDECLKNDNLLVQEVIQQHSVLESLHNGSINTIRIMTLYFEDKVNILSSVVRMGIADSKVDNASSGGIVCGINSDGSLKKIAFDVKANRYDRHPDGASFEGVTIPGYTDCVELCKRLAPRFVKYTRLISWDLAIDTTGKPVLIEANLKFGEVDFHQMCNGPIFGEKTEKVLKYVFSNNKLLKN